MKNDMKKQYRDFVESVFDEIDDGDRDEDDKAGTKDMRAKTFEFAFQAVNRMKSRTHLLESSFTNFGVDLPLDGSKDSSEETIHVDGKYARHISSNSNNSNSSS